jgi:hypothetical protein
MVKRAHNLLYSNRNYLASKLKYLSCNATSQDMFLEIDSKTNMGSPLTFNLNEDANNG